MKAAGLLFHSKAAERPGRFRMNGRQYTVEDKLDQWYEPESIS